MPSGSVKRRPNSAAEAASGATLIERYALPKTCNRNAKAVETAGLIVEVVISTFKRTCREPTSPSRSNPSLALWIPLDARKHFNLKLLTQTKRLELFHIFCDPGSPQR